MKKTCMTLIALSTLCQANERKFSYTYETATMPQGQVELEAWNTLRHGKENFYQALDQRLELEFGITNKLQGALYLNSRSENYLAKDKDGKFIADGDYLKLEQKHAFKGFSFELKHQLMNSNLNPFGFAYYTEIGVQTKELELEGKLLFDKSFGKWTTALNLEGEAELEYEVESEGNETETELEAEAFKWGANLGLSYALSPRQGFGIESRLHKVSEEDEQEVAVFAGPSWNFAGEKWWGVVSVLPQIGSKTEFHEKLEARFLLGFHI